MELSVYIKRGTKTIPIRILRTTISNLENWKEVFVIMTSTDKNEVWQMRLSGMSYRQIAEVTGFSENTIKSLCRRNKMQEININENNNETLAHCKNCGNQLVQSRGHRQRKFCSDKCRFAWWHGKNAVVGRESPYFFSCKNCGKEFISYGNKDRKYCCYNCYTLDRFKH